MLRWSKLNVICASVLETNSFFVSSHDGTFLPALFGDEAVRAAELGLSEVYRANGSELALRLLGVGHRAGCTVGGPGKATSVKKRYVDFNITVKITVPVVSTVRFGAEK